MMHQQLTITTYPLPPLSLYVHIPWCVRKCPYCDFNSHKKPDDLPIEEYLNALLDDLTLEAEFTTGRKIHSVFFGGGTPSLFPPSAIEKILDHADTTLGIEYNAEITLEANPGTTEYFDFNQLKSAGVNRLSIGVQSFDNKQLKTLGRIHNKNQIHTAYAKARQAKFDNINLDLMHGLPNQTLAQGLEDLQQAISLGPEHLSWYQLTIEPNTEFYSRPPTLPEEDTLVDILEEGGQLLASNGYNQYEISAFSKPGRQASHNINYWQFGDYIGIGAGAHGKISQAHSTDITRTQKTRLPKDYMDKNTPYSGIRTPIKKNQLPLEFMMNALRLSDGITLDFWEKHTRLSLDVITAKIESLKNRGLTKTIQQQTGSNLLVITPLGKRFLNDVLEEFVE